MDVAPELMRDARRAVAALVVANEDLAAGKQRLVVMDRFPRSAPARCGTGGTRSLSSWVLPSSACEQVEACHCRGISATGEAFTSDLICRTEYSVKRLFETERVKRLSDARSAHRWAAAIRLSFKTGFVISAARPSSAWHARDIVWNHRTYDHSPDTHPVLNSLARAEIELDHLLYFLGEDGIPGYAPAKDILHEHKWKEGATSIPPYYLVPDGDEADEEYVIITTVYGDRYGGEWPREQFRKHGVNYEPAENSKSEIYVDLLPLINSGAVDLLEHDRLVTQLTSLERRTSRGGRDSIDHTPGAHDDVANAVAGALVTTFREPGVKNFNRKISYQPLGII
jgi:hypothetical protein